MVGCVVVCFVILSFGGEVCEVFEIVSFVRCSNGLNVRSLSFFIFLVDFVFVFSFLFV